MATLDRMADQRQRATTLSAEIDAIYAAAASEKRPLSADDHAAIKLKNDEFNPLVASIKSYDAHEETKGSLTGPVNKPEGPGAGMTASGGSRVTNVTDREAGRPFMSLGEQLLSIRAAHSNTGQPIDKRLIRLDQEIRAASGMSEGVPSDGGFAVQQDFVQNIIGRVFDQSTGAIASRVQRIDIGPNSNGIKQNVIDETSRVNGSRWGGVQTYWAAEADTVTATKPKLRRMEMELEKLMAIWYLTEELTQDSTAMSSVAETAFAEELQFKIEDGIINGTGVAQMLGILNSPAKVEQAIEATQSIANTASFISANTSKMLARFNGSRARAAWFANIELFPKFSLATLGGTSQPVYLNGGTIANAPFGTVWGIPTFFVEYAAAEGTVGDIILADLGWYAMIAKGAPKFAMSMHVRFLNDENTFKLTFRTNGQPIPRAPITPYKGSATRSPFVVLGARS
jgi:HK97 family phage major capsid protein